MNLGKTFRSRKYTNWVKSQSCCICGAPADDPHHLIGIGGLGGMGMQASDILTMPLCRGHHREMHENPEIQQEQWEMICRTIEAATRQGIITVNGK